MIRAAGGVVVRPSRDDVEVLVVHRPKYDDWSFPKGKALRGESDEECAVREVHEETGLLCELARELPSTSYRDAKGRRKYARYWLMTPGVGNLAFRHEVDDAVWLPVAEAKARLTHPRDRAVIANLTPEAASSTLGSTLRAPTPRERRSGEAATWASPGWDDANGGRPGKGLGLGRRC